MKFSQESLDNGYVITAYEPGRIKIREAEYQTSILLMPERLIDSWAITSMDQLSRDKLFELTELEPEIIIFGSGEQQVFPHPNLFAPLMDKGIGYEVMNTGAACRTYNILLSEDRRVLAALIL